VQECLRSGWITTGPRVERFERMLADYLGATQVIALSSATAGLHLALRTLELRPGDEVITTPLTFVATVNTIIEAGATPVFVDIDADTRNIDVARLADAVSDRTRALVPVHFAGLPVDLDPLYDLATRHGLRVIEDAAHAIGAEYAGRRIGSFGDTQVFSFHPNKNMTTGEGGCVSTSDPKLAAALRTLSFHGIDREDLSESLRAEGAPYDVAAVGFKYNMMDIQAALGLHQLPELDGFIGRRTQIARAYLERLASSSAWELPADADPSHRHAWHLFTAVLRPEKARIDRGAFVRGMKDRGIGIGIHYPAVHLFRLYRSRFGFRPGSFPVAERIGRNVVSLPLFPAMNDADVDRVVRAIEEVLA